MGLELHLGGHGRYNSTCCETRFIDVGLYGEFKSSTRPFTDLATTDQSVLGQDDSFFDIDVLVDAAASLHNAILVDNDSITDQGVFDCAIVLNHGVIPDDASSDGNVLTNRAISSNHGLVYD